MADSISDVLPDCPGVAIVIDAGFAISEKSGPGVTVMFAVPCEDT